MSEASNDPTGEIIAKKVRNFSQSQSDGERGNAPSDRRAKTPDDGGEYWTGPSLFSGIPGGLEPSATKNKSAPKERHMQAGIEPSATYMRSLSLGQTKKMIICSGARYLRSRLRPELGSGRSYRHAMATEEKRMYPRRDQR